MPQFNGLLLKGARAAHVHLHASSEARAIGQRGGHAAQTTFGGFILPHILENRVTSSQVWLRSSRGVDEPVRRNRR
ncbi:hypothetical protein OKW27_003990 [Paraburkholderia sp. 35.1]